MNRTRPVSMGANPLFSAVLLVAMAFSLSGCPAVVELLGDAPFNGVYCYQNESGCHDRERESSSEPVSTGTPDPAPSQPTGPASPTNPT